MSGLVGCNNGLGEGMDDSWRIVTGNCSLASRDDGYGYSIRRKNGDFELQN